MLSVVACGSWREEEVACLAVKLELHALPFVPRLVIFAVSTPRRSIRPEPRAAHQLPAWPERPRPVDLSNLFSGLLCGLGVRQSGADAWNLGNGAPVRREMGTERQQPVRPYRGDLPETIRTIFDGAGIDEGAFF